MGGTRTNTADHAPFDDAQATCLTVMSHEALLSTANDEYQHLCGAFRVAQFHSQRHPTTCDRSS